MKAVSSSRIQNITFGHFESWIYSETLLHLKLSFLHKSKTPNLSWIATFGTVVSRTMTKQSINVYVYFTTKTQCELSSRCMLGIRSMSSVRAMLELTGSYLQNILPLHICRLLESLYVEFKKKINVHQN